MQSCGRDHLTQHKSDILRVAADGFCMWFVTVIKRPIMAYLINEQIKPN